MEKKIAIIVPAFNEETSVAEVVNGILEICRQNQLPARVVVVNDCSTDSTAEIIERLPCIALHLPINTGIGGGMQTGFRYALENHFAFALQADGDGQHPSEELPKLVAAMKEKNADVVIGSRFLGGKGFRSTFLRRAGIAWFRWLNRLLTGYDIKDSTSGFRLLNRKALAIVSETYPDEYPEPESIILFAKNKLAVTEVSVNMKERQGGISSIGFFSGIYYMWKATLGIIFTFMRTQPNKIQLWKEYKSLP